MEYSTDKKRKRVFLSFATEDRDFSKRIARQLERSGLDVWFSESELFPGDSMLDKIGKAVSSSDYIFLIVSKNSMKSDWVNSEFSKYMINELVTRNVTIVPILVDDSEVPAYLRGYQTLDLRSKTDPKVAKLVRQIAYAPRIDFSSFTKEKFERLVFDLLKSMGFKKISKQIDVQEKGADFRAEFTQRDPFGVEDRQIWIVETKFYRQDRPSVDSIRQMLGSLSFFPNAKGLLVTNGLLTSYAKEATMKLRKENAKPLRVIEGPELRSLLLRFPRLIEKYFMENVREVC